MVLLCDNKILTIETFHKNRCREKNENLEIFVKMKFEEEELALLTKLPSELSNEIRSSIPSARLVAGTRTITKDLYDCKKPHKK